MTRHGENNPFFGRRHTEEWRAEASERQTEWTGEQVAAVRDWYLERQSAKLDLSALARAVGKTPSAVSRLAGRLGLSKQSRKTGRKATAKHATPEDRNAAIGAASRKRIAEHGHPRGALGMKHTDESRAKISASQLALSAAGVHPGQRQRPQAERDALSLRMVQRLKSSASVYSRCKHGRRADLDDQFFRSSWEANYARFLNFLRARGDIAKWEYEADTFWFEAIRRGVRSYTPDFKITEPGGAVYYVEVKGWMDPKSATKIKRMAKYHPTVDLRVFGAKAYYELERKLGPALAGWEAS